MKNSEKSLLRAMVKIEIANRRDIDTATENIMRSEDFKRATIRSYYKTFATKESDS